MREDDLLADEARYCSFGDTVHYVQPPKIFDRCDGSYLFDAQGVPYLDLQMWYSAVNFGYANQRLNDVMKRQLDTLPQVASQYLHPTKIELAKVVAEDAFRKWGTAGRVHFNVGGSQSIEDSLKLVRNASAGKSLMFAFEGGYHGRTLGASAITSSYRYRRRFGHFGERAHFVPFPYHFRGGKGMGKEEYGEHCVREFARLFETEYNGFWDAKARQCEYAAFYVEAVQGTGGYVIPPKNFFVGLKEVLDRYGVLLVVDEIQMGFYRTGKLWGIEHFGVTPDILVFGKALTNGLNPLAGLWARENLISPTMFPPGSTHSTFASNPLGTAVGLETMRMLAETDYESMVMAKGAHFLDGLKAPRSATSTGSAWRCVPRSARPTASRRTRRWSTGWSRSACRAASSMPAAGSASSSTSAATTRTSSPSRPRCTSAARRSTSASPSWTSCCTGPSASCAACPARRRERMRR